MGVEMLEVEQQAMMQVYMVEVEQKAMMQVDIVHVKSGIERFLPIPEPTLKMYPPLFMALETKC